MTEQDDSGNSEVLEATAATAILRSLKEYGVTHIYGNFGTDHPPFLEAAAVARDRSSDDIPNFIACPHEAAALSAAHGHAVTTGVPQAVLVHVDVGTQNLGAMVHNAHRGNAPVFIIAGLAPISHSNHSGSRTSRVHFLQDIYDQRNILAQFCNWTNEYRPPADPDEFVARGLELATTPRKGPVYMTATREALESTVTANIGARRARGVQPSAPSGSNIDRVCEMIRSAESPLVLTSKLGASDPVQSVCSLVKFAETAGAGVVEASPAALCFPRTHELHAGFTTESALTETDLIILADIDVPWVPRSQAAPPSDVPVVQIDIDPEKRTYPQWGFSVDYAVRTDPAPTLAAMADRLDSANGETGREMWRSFGQSRAEERQNTIEQHKQDDRLTPSVLTDAINRAIDQSTIVANEATTNNLNVLQNLRLDQPGSYYSSHGSGLGWAPGAAIGMKLARPDSRVISLVGDGSYVFGHPTATAWMAGAHDAPTLTIIYNNSGWNAVRESVRREHPNGSSLNADVPESKFRPTMDLSHATNVVDAYSHTVTSPKELDGVLDEAVTAVDSGTPAVLDIRLEPI